MKVFLLVGKNDDDTHVEGIFSSIDKMMTYVEQKSFSNTVDYDCLSYTVWEMDRGIVDHGDVIYRRENVVFERME